MPLPHPIDQKKVDAIRADFLEKDAGGKPRYNLTEIAERHKVAHSTVTKYLSDLRTKKSRLPRKRRTKADLETTTINKALDKSDILPLQIPMIPSLQFMAVESGFLEVVANVVNYLRSFHPDIDNITIYPKDGHCDVERISVSSFKTNI